MADDAPAWEDIPAWDDLPDPSSAPAAQGTREAAPSWDDLPETDEPQKPQAEGHIMADVREVGHAALPAAAGYAAAGVGAELGAAAGAPLAPFTAGLSIPIGGALGAIVGFAGGGLAMSAVQERAAKLFGLDDTAQRQANIEERPLETWAAGMATGAAGMSLGAGVKVWQRLISAGALTTFEGAQQYMTEGKFDPVKLAIAASLGAVLPVPNRVGGALIGAGESAGKNIVNGVRVRPGGSTTSPPPEEGFDPTTGESLEAVDAAVGPLAESAGPGTGAQAPEHGGSAKVYPKGAPGEQAKYKDALGDPELMRQFAFDEGLTEAEAREIAQANYNEPNAGVSTGQIRPDVGAALKAAQPEELPLKTGIEENLPPVTQPQQPPEARQGQLGLTPRVTPRRSLRIAEEVKEDSKQPGIQQPTEHGEEEQHQVTPVGVNAAKPKLGVKPREAIATADAAPKWEELPAAHPLETGMGTARPDVHPEPSERQIEAENYNKGHPGRFAGKDVSIETAKGGIRRSKPGQEPWEVEMPTDYGHLLRTTGADGDQLDIHYAGTGDKHFVIDQRDLASGKFDEHKIMSFAKDEANARELYDKGFSDNKGAERLQGITEATEDEIRAWANRLANQPRLRKQPYGAAWKELPGRAEPMKTYAGTGVGTQIRRAIEAEDARRANPPDIKFRDLADEKPVTATVTKSEPEVDRGTNPSPPEDRTGVLAKDRVAVRDMLKKMRAEGRGAEADKIEAMPDADLLKYVEDSNLRRRRYGVSSGTSAGYPVADLMGPNGTPVTAKTKALAKIRGDAITKVREAFNEASLPSQIKPEQETNGELLQRVKQAWDTGGEAHKVYKPQDAGNRIEWSWMKEAGDLLKKPTEKNIAAFREAERELRGGRDMALDRLQGKRIQADIEKSRRSGDEAVDRAEARAAELDAGRNATEDELIDAIDAKRNPKAFDTPHEEAEAMVKPTPVKSAADLKEPTGKQIDVTKPGGEDAVSKILEAGKVARKTPLAEEAVAAGKKVKITAADQERYKAMLDKAVARGKAHDKVLDFLPEEADPDAPTTKRMRDLFDEFSKDERGSLDINKVMDDLKNSVRAFNKPHEADTYISKKSNGPADDYARSLDEKLFAARQEDKNTLIRLMQHAARLGEDGIDHALMEKIYAARDKEQAGISTLAKELTPAELGLYNKFMKPVTDFANEKFKLAKSYDTDGLIGPEVMSHQSRITKGQSEEYNVLKTGQSDDPIEGRINGIATAAKKTALDRKFFVLERQDGKRFVISQNQRGYTIWDKYRGTRIVDPNFAFKAGEKYKVKNNTYEMKQALTEEIEANGRMEGGALAKYFHNSALSDVLDAATMDSLARNMKLVMDIKNDDNFQKFTTTSSDIAAERSKALKGEQWEKLTLPNFQQYYAHPDLAAMLNSYAAPGLGGLDKVRGIAQGITKLMFWLPTAHINNVGAHWFVERGWQWLNPVGYRRLVVTGMQAIKSVMTQDPTQMTLRSEGAGLMSGGPITKDWYQKVGKLLGEHIEANPAKWDKIAKQFGWGPSTLAKAVYDGSSRIMWAADDMFKTQAYLELMDRGYSMKGAIRTAERHIPNYRLPGKIIGSGRLGRAFQQVVSEPTLISFGRYHYEVFNSFAHIAKDMVHGDAKQKFEAIGNIMAMGILGLGIYPILDKAMRVVTGNEHASAHRRGPMAVGSAINSAANASKDPMAAPRAALTVSPLAQALLEARSNKDFAGRNIIEPGDVERAAHGSPKGAAKVVEQGGEYLARSLVSPYGTLANAYQTKKQGPLATIRDQAMDIRNPSPKAIKYEGLAGKKAMQESQSRYKQGGRGPLEHVLNKILGY